MNLLQRIIRLPLVSKTSPIITTSIWLICTALSFQKNITSAPENIQADTTIKGYTPFTFISHIISKYNRNRVTDPTTEEETERTAWVINTAISLIRYLVENITKKDVPNLISGNEMPSIVAGYIDTKHIVNNMQGKTFIVAISKKIINYLGFTFVVIKIITFVTMLIYILKFLFKRYIESYIEDYLDDTIDIETRPIEKTLNSLPPFIEKYIKKQ